MTRVLSASFGITMTLVKFVKVIKETEKTLLVVPIATRVVIPHGTTGTAYPVVNRVIGKPFRVYKRFDQRRIERWQVYYVGQDFKWYEYDMDANAGLFYNDLD